MGYGSSGSPRMGPVERGHGNLRTRSSLEAEEQWRGGGPERRDPEKGGILGPPLHPEVENLERKDP